MKIFPAFSETLESCVSYCWDEDEWARGAYSILKSGETFSLLPHIARPEGSAFRGRACIHVARLDAGRA